MNKKLLFSLSLAAASLTASFNGAAADWQDTSNLTPEPPPQELTAAAAAAPGAAPAAEATAPPTAPAAAPVPAQVDVLPAPVSAPPEEINAPAAAAPPPRVSKASAIVLRPAALRSRPTSAGKGDPIAAETRVRLESSIRNADGTWWFVTAAGIGGGWLLESELGDPQN